ncbi:MAG TPA: ATP-binding protein [Myxococcota bacterium]|nr:ATP-binding protein [Myxococcota bacterium]HRY96607.1 ATP-binding protein [Myxococcota bacterium]
MADNPETLEQRKIDFESLFEIGELNGGDILKFLEACECRVRWVNPLDPNRNKVWAILVRPESNALVDGFGLGREVLVLCSNHKDLQARLLDNIEIVDRLIKTPNRRQEDLVIVVSDAPNTTSVLEKLEDTTTVYLPLDSCRMKSWMSSGHPSEEFRAILQERMYARDFFDRSGPVNGREFFGRKRILQDIASQLSRGSHLGLYGLRKVGKTSIIKTLLERRESLCPDLFFVHLDLLAAPETNRTHHFLLHLIAKNMKEAVEASPARSWFRSIGHQPRYDQITDFETFERSFDSDIRTILSEFSDQKKRLVIILDEIERLFPLGTNSGYTGYDKFLEYTRGLSQAVGPLSLMVVGVNPYISEAHHLGKHQNPMFGFYTTRYATPLVKDELQEMIRVLGRSSGAYFEAEAITELDKMLGGHPYLTRRYCSMLISDKQRPVNVTKPMVVEARERFLRRESCALAEMVSVVKDIYPDEFTTLQRIADENGVESDRISRQTFAHLEGYQLVEELDGRIIIRNGLVRDWLTGISRPLITTCDSRSESVQATSSAQGVKSSLKKEELEELLRKTEADLRRTVKMTLHRRWAGKTSSRIRSSVGEEAFMNAQQRLEKSLRKAPEDDFSSRTEILDYMYLGDLKKIIIGDEWQEFRGIFDDKKELTRNLSIANDASIELRHGRQMSEKEMLRALLSASDLQEQLKKFGL